MKALIIGGNGFVGRNLCLKLEDRNIPYLSLDNNSVFKENFKEKNFEVFDITKDSLTAINEINTYTHLINLAAIHHIPTCTNNPSLAEHTNVYGAIKIAREAAKLGIKNQYFASSGAVYKPTTEIMNEKAKVQASDQYSFTKICAETNLAELANFYAINVISMRFFNIIGRYDMTPHLLPEVVWQIFDKRTKNIELGNIDRFRNYIHVEDIVTGILTLMEQSFNGFNVFNICADEELSVSQIVEKAISISGVSKKYFSVKSRTRKNDRRHQRGDNEKLRKLGWKPKRSIDESIKDFLVWYKQDVL